MFSSSDRPLPDSPGEAVAPLNGTLFLICMNRLYLLGIACGVLLASGALIWWSFEPASGELHSGSSHDRHDTASESNTVSKNRTRSAGEDLADAPSQPPAELPEESSLELERRCLHLAERDPRAAVILAIDTQAADTHPGLMENLTAQWAMHDFQDAHEWVLQQEPGERRDGLMARVAFARSQSNPAAAAQVVINEMAPGNQQTEAVISVLHQWALRDMDGASAWVNQFPEGALRERAFDELEGVQGYLQAMAADARGK